MGSNTENGQSLNTDNHINTTLGRRSFLKGAAGAIGGYPGRMIQAATFERTATAVIFGAAAGTTAMIVKEVTKADIDPSNYTKKTYSEEKLQSQPFDEEYDILPAPGYPQLRQGALVYTREGWAEYMQDETRRSDSLGRSFEQRPKAYRMILMMKGSDQYPMITLSPDGYVSVQNGKLNLDKEGHFLSARLEYLPREDNSAILQIIEFMPDGTQIPQEPNLITFPQHKYPPQNEIRTAIYSTESLSVPVVDAVYALQTRFKDFAGADFPLSFYNPGDDSPEIPDFIQMLSGTNAILPKSLIKESISFIEIATYYTLAGKLYDLVNSDNSRFQGDAEIAKYKFNDIFKDFVNKYNGQVPTRGLYPDGTDINQENDRVAVALKACDIASYLNDSDRGKFYFGEIRNDPRAFFASTLTVFNFFADKFKMAKNDEYKSGKQISGDIEKICRPVYTLLRSINGNLDAQSKLVKGLPETGLVSYQFS